MNDYWTVTAKKEVKNIPVDYPDQLNNNLFRYERLLFDFVIANREVGLFCKLQYSCNIHKEETMNKLFGYVKEEMECLFKELQTQLIYE